MKRVEFIICNRGYVYKGYLTIDEAVVVVGGRRNYFCDASFAHGGFLLMNASNVVWDFSVFSRETFQDNRTSGPEHFSLPWCCAPCLGHSL